MSVAFGSSSFVSDGLVLYLDPSNPKNYILTEAEVLAIGGGGGGSENQYDDGSGGGGGGFIQRMIQISSSTAYTITVGTGGGTGGSGSVGGNTSAFGLIAYGGGGASSHRSSGGAVNGASGGGSGGQYSADIPIVGRAIYGPEQGNDGGYSITYGGGGGGGAGSAGQGAIVYGHGGYGGRGRSSSISGTLRYYSGGGGGFGYANLGRGGIGGGGSPGVSPQANSGGGGGGGKTTGTRSTAGAAGVVIIRYPGPQKATGGNTIVTIGGYTIHTFTSTGTFTTLAVPANSGAVYGLQDLSGNNNTGTQSGGVTYNSANGGSLVFDGVDDRVDLSTATGTVSQYTIAYWAKRDAENRMPVSTINADFYWFGDNSWRYVHGGVAGEYYYSKPTSISLGTWGYYAVVYNGSNVSIYRQGIYQGQQATTGTANFSSALRIGWWGSNTYAYLGNIANVSFYNRALTTSEIQQNFNALRGRFGI